ncbi:MAG: diguanylate cyclase, partial [Candidatus Limnocylindrales bacterium]
MDSPAAASEIGQGRPRRAARPALLLLVLAAFLLIVGVTASGQAALVTGDQQHALLVSTVSADASAVRTLVGLSELAPGDLVPGGLTAAHRATLQAGLGLLTGQQDFVHTALLLPDGTVVASNDGSGVGARTASTADLQRAVGTQQAQATIVTPGEAGLVVPSTTSAILREYLPVIADGQVRAVMVVARDATPILAALDQERVDIVGITLGAAFISVLVLTFIFRTAQRRLSRQAQQLVEAAGRDPLTGLPNHGALVELLGARLEAARVAGRAVGVALLDLDNFRLLNETYGHPAGDFALLEVAGLLAARAPAGALIGRYGPDEFLVVGSAEDAGLVEPAMEHLRAALADLSLQFEASERLPVTVSVGISLFPVNGASVTPLLAAAAAVLDEAKTSGGDVVRVADERAAEHGASRTFDVLQGLVIAVDTKDRYTRRHSEDVARYADFLARQLDLDLETRRAVHTAGLLHDVGKIGIPDVILRKPGKLTDEEYEIVKQHVTLGDLIVQDVPDIT